MTFAELVLESSVYEHSTEYYNTVKECAEVDVINQFLRTQEFKENNWAVVENVSSISGDSYIMESSNPMEIQSLMEMKEVKIKSVLSTWKKRALKLLSALVSMAANLYTKLKTLNEPARKCSSMLNKVDKETGLKIADKVAYLAIKYNLDFGDSMPNDNGNISKLIKTVGDTDKMLLLAYSLSFSKVTLYGTGLIDLTAIPQLVGYMKNPDHNIMTLSKNTNDNRTKMIRIDPLKLQGVIDSLNKSIEELKNYLISDDDIKAASNSTANLNMNVYNVAINNLMTAISKDIALMGNYLKFRTESLNTINKMLKEDSESGNESDKSNEGADQEKAGNSDDE